MLAAIDTVSPMGKRDRAILLLACRMGMRAGDIRTLTLDSIHWAATRIAFAQQKTDAIVELPMTDEVAEALIDYLRHGRPATLRRELFLRGNAPFEPFGTNNNLDEGRTIDAVVDDLGLTRSSFCTWLRQARIDRGKGKGGLTSDERTELAKLRKEVKTLQEEKTILKKWVAFCAKENA